MFILIGISISFGISTIFSIKSLAEIIGGYLAALLSALTQGAIWVTGIFGLLEYFQVSLESVNNTKPWEPSDLPALPKEKALISRGESIFSIIVTTLFFPFFSFHLIFLVFIIRWKVNLVFFPSLI